MTGSPVVSAAPLAYRVVPGVGRANVSPDGRWLVTANQQSGASAVQAVRLFTNDGAPVREVRDAGSFWGWLSDSSGVLIATSLPQRAPPLGIIELDGRVVTTELQLSSQMLSRDGKLLVTNQQEGCCVSITQREIRVAGRDGTDTRTLVVSDGPLGTESVTLLGIDASDRAVYRDGTKIKRIPLLGGAATTLATSSEYARVVQGSASPDGAAIIARGYEPAQWFVIANDRVVAWDNGPGSIVEDGSPGFTKSGATALWIGPHTFLARDPAGSLVAVDAVTNIRASLTGKLVSSDVVLAHESGRLLIVRGGVVVLLNTTTGDARDIGLDLRPNNEGAQAVGLRSGGFLLSNSKETYRID